MVDSWASHTALCTGQHLVDKFTSTRWTKYTVHVTKLRTKTKSRQPEWKSQFRRSGFGTEDNIITKQKQNVRIQAVYF